MSSVTAVAVTPTILMWITGFMMPFWKACDPENFAIINKVVFNGTMCIGIFQSMGVVAITKENAVTIYAHFILSLITIAILLPVTYLFSPTRKFHLGVFGQMFMATTVGNVLVVGVPIIRGSLPEYENYLYILLMCQNTMLPLYIGIFELYKYLANKDPESKQSKLHIAKKVMIASLTAPLSIATIFAGIWMFISTYSKDRYALRNQWPPIVYDYFSYLNQATVPMGTVSLGLFTHSLAKRFLEQLKNSVKSPKSNQILPNWILITFILAYKNFLCPPLTGWICSWFGVSKSIIDANMIAQASPCALLSFVFSSMYGCNASPPALWVIINNFLLFGSVPYILALIKHLFV